jgi:hypothetical protein
MPGRLNGKERLKLGEEEFTSFSVQCELPLTSVGQGSKGEDDSTVLGKRRVSARSMNRWDMRCRTRGAHPYRDTTAETVWIEMCMWNKKFWGP